MARNEGGKMDEETIIIPRSEFAQALKTLQVAAKGKNPPQLLVRCEAGALVLQVGGVTVTLPGEGSFTGQARLSARAIKALSQALPDDDPLPVSRHTEPDRLGIGSLRLQCHWDEIDSTPVKPPPLDAPDLDLLKWAQSTTQQEIDHLGYGEVIIAARKRLIERVEKAYYSLKHYGFTRDEIRTMVEQAIQGK